MARGKRRGVRGGGGGEQLSESNGHEMFSGEMMDKGRPTLRGRPFQAQRVFSFNASRLGCVLRMEPSSMRSRLNVKECWASRGRSQASGLLL